MRVSIEKGNDSYENGKSWKRGGGRFELLKLTALILTIITVLTMPLAVSKYAATGTGSAVARIAKWDVAAKTESTNATVVFRDGNFFATTGSTNTQKTFKFTNNAVCEVMATVDNVTFGSDVATLARASFSAPNILPGNDGEVTVNLQATPKAQLATAYDVTCQIHYDIRQVD